MGGTGSKGFAGDRPGSITFAFEISNQQIVGMNWRGEKAADREDQGGRGGGFYKCGGDGLIRMLFHWFEEKAIQRVNRKRGVQNG